MKKHNERCKECKKKIFELLEKIYGEGNVYQNYNINFPNKTEEIESKEYTNILNEILFNLQEHRGHKDFVRSKNLPNVDFYIKDSFILEFDESQHFTKPRLITLESYPKNLSLGYEKETWVKLCLKLNKKDNDPPYRDEQRAWYDTLRDFAPSILKISPTIRLYASEYIWCSLDSNSEADINKFKNIISKY